MNEELKQEALKRLVEYLGTAEQLVKSGGDFAAEQMPLLVQEMIAWGLWSATARLAFSVIAFVVGVCLIRRGAKDPNADLGPPLIGLGLFVGVLGFIGTVFETQSVIKVTAAPRIYVLEQLKDFVQ